jgi:PhnB protein
MASKKRPAKKKARKAARKAAPKKPSPIPAGYHTVTAYLVQDDCARAMDFYKTAFGAKEIMRMAGPGGKISHAEVQVGDSRVMMSDTMPPMPGQPGVYKSPKAAGLATASLFLYVKDVNGVFDRAVKAGCTVRAPLADMFWGDRFGTVIDPFGHSWSMATHTEDVSPAEMGRRQQEFMAKMSQGGHPV